MKKLTLILLSISVILIFLSCQKGEKEVFTGERGGELVIGTINEPSNLNPIYPPIGKSIGVENLLFLSLHGKNAEGKIVPQLATSWEYSEDFKSITYYLRKDVTWTDGKPVTAEDVKFTFDLIKNPDVASPIAASVRFIDSAKVVNTYAIRFYFKKAYADELLDSGITPLPKHILDGVKDIQRAAFNTSPVGNGPYKLQKWDIGKSITLVANDNYYKGKPPLDKIIFWFAHSEDELATQLLEGNIDIVEDVSPAVYEKIKNNKDINIIIKPGHSYTYIGWNLENPLFKDKNMRLALTYAINRQKLVSDVLLKLADIAKGPIPPTSWAYNENVKIIPYNPQKASQLLDEMGWQMKGKVRKKEKKTLSFTLITNKENPIRVQIAKFIADELANIGVKVNLKLLDTPTFINRLVSKDFDAFILGWSVKDRIDPTMVWNSDPHKGKFNLVSYKNPKVDEMIDKGLLTLDRRETKKIWSEFQQIISEDIPNTFLFYPKEISAANKRVNGIKENDRRFILADIDHYWIPSSLRKTISIAALESLEVEQVTEKPVTPTAAAPIAKEKPVVNPEVLLEKKAKEEAAKAAREKQTEKKTEVAKGEKPIPPAITTTTPTKPIKAETTKTAPPKPEIPPTLPKIKKLVLPEYPEAAKLVSAQGNVFVQVVVGPDGRVKSAKIIRSFGNPACDAAALRAARATFWIPGTKNGKPVEMTQTYPIRFPPQ